jgi:hypothetical protein
MIDGGQFIILQLKTGQHRKQGEELRKNEI